MPHCTGHGAGRSFRAHQCRRRPRNRHLCRASAIAATALLIVACEPATLFVTDPFAEEIVAYAGEERRRIEELLNRAPQPEEYFRVGLGEDPVGVLGEAFDPEAPDLVFLTPYLADTAITLAAQYGRTQFVLLGETQANQAAATGEANIVSVEFDRTGAMAEAGRISAHYLRRQDTERRLLLLAVVNTPQRRSEIDAFMEAFRDLAEPRTDASSSVDSEKDDRGDPGPLLDDVLYDELPTRDELRSRLRDVHEEYAAIAVFLGRRSPYVIEQVSSTELPYGSENLGLFDPLWNRMLFTVETRTSDALEAYLDSRESEAAVITANARVIRGPALEGGETSGETSN